MEFKRDALMWMASGRYYAKVRYCCHGCDASRSLTRPHLAFDDPSKDAGWRATIVTTAKYLERTPPGNRSPLTEIYGWCHELDTSLDDYLHMLHQGQGTDVTAGTILYLCHRGFYGDGPLEKQLENCHGAMMTVKGKMGLPTFLPMFTRERLGLEKKSAFPALAGKAALIKEMVFVVAHEAELYHIAQWSDPEAKTLAAMTGALASHVHVMDLSEEVMTDAQKQQYLRTGQVFLECYIDLAHHAVDRGERLWRTRPKFHSLMHTLAFVEATGLNPRFWACWMDEDFLGKLRDICQQLCCCKNVVVAERAIKRMLWNIAEMVHETREDFAEPFPRPLQWCEASEIAERSSKRQRIEAVVA